MIESVCKLIIDHYVHEEVAIKCAAYLRKRLNSKTYLDSDDKNFAKILTHDLIAFTQDKHLRVRLKKKPKSKKELLKFFNKVNFGFEKVKLQKHGICYLQYNGFLNPDEIFDGKLIVLEKTKERMKELKKACPKVIIFDLRKNKGGSPKMVQFLCSYFLKSNVPLNTLIGRHQPTGIFNSLPDEVIPKRNRLLQPPLYILTSKKTFSAAEEFTNNLRACSKSSIG